MSGTDATTALLRAIRKASPAEPIFSDIRSRGWRGPTFAGARHEVALRLEGEKAETAADDLVSHLDDLEIGDGHILADLALVDRKAQAGAVTLRLEALTVEDAR